MLPPGAGGQHQPLWGGMVTPPPHSSTAFARGFNEFDHHNMGLSQPGHCTPGQVAGKPLLGQILVNPFYMDQDAVCSCLATSSTKGCRPLHALSSSHVHLFLISACSAGANHCSSSCLPLPARPPGQEVV